MKTTQKQVEKAFLKYTKDLHGYDLIDIFAEKYEYDAEAIDKFIGELSTLLMAYFTKKELLNIIIDGTSSTYTMELLERCKI